MDIRVLGPFEVERDGELLGLGGRKQRSVLAALVLHAREVISGDRLADAVWDGEAPASVDTTLRGYVSNLRKVLEPDRGPKDPPRILRTSPAGYVLDVPDETIDARRAEQLVALGRERSGSGDVAGAVEAWSEALALWRGDALQDFAYDGFVQIEAARLTELRLACMEDLFDAQLELGRHGAVVGDLEAFCAANPSRERALLLRMLALYRCGRQTESLEVYEAGRRRLAEELGVDPSPELRATYERILRQDDALAAGGVAARPSGKQTLTFLLGDVERSTERLRALGDDYAAVLEENRRTLREALETHGGRAIRTYGDGIFAAFDAATDAMAAAVAAQLAMCREGLDDDRTLPVRMGLHTGEATYSGGEYVGLAIHLAARIMDAAHGGQILVSGATKELFEAEEGEDAGLVDLGLHTLKDVPDAVHLFQVVHPELRGDFLPLRTRSGPTDNLPNRIKSFVGRGRDLEGIEEALGDARVVTLTGVGGVGKTTLAMEVGRRVGSRYPDGVWLCELASISGADEIVRSLATTLGVQQQPGRTLRDSLLGALAQRSSLLILDNCEHLLEPVAELVEEMVYGSGATDVLATSREALGVDGERSRPVRSLAADDVEAGALRLFEDRARDARPDFSIDDRNRADVGEICKRLDGIPLAIELAAARVTSLSPAQISKRLEEGFHFLRSGRRAAVDRHRTLHGAIAWQYDMLSEAERLLFDRLSVFAEGFTLEAAEEVCGRGLDLDVADGLASLVAKSMVAADVTGAEARYSLLETLRQYGQDRLAERREADELLVAHARYFVRWLEASQARSLALDVDSEAETRRVGKEWGNLRAAHAWAVSAGDVDLAVRFVAAARWPIILQLRLEGYAWAEAAAAMPGAPDHPLYPDVLTIISNDAARRGELERALELATRAHELVDDPDDPRRIWSLAQRSNVHMFRGELDEAIPLLEEVGRLARLHEEVPMEIFATGGRALRESYAGRHETAVDLAEEAYRRAREGSSAMQGFSLYNLGEVLAEAGTDPDRAMEVLDRAIETTRANDMRFLTGVALVSAVSLRARHGEPVEALTMFREVIDHWRLAGNWQQQWTTLRNLVELFGRLEEDEVAAVLLAASEASPTAAPTFGAQGERLAALVKELEGRMGAEAFERASDRGRRMSDGEVLVFVKAEIGRALERVRPELEESS